MVIFFWGYSPEYSKFSSRLKAWGKKPLWSSWRLKVAGNFSSAMAKKFIESLTIKFLNSKWRIFAPRVRGIRAARPWSYSASKMKFPSKPLMLWKKEMTLWGLSSPYTSVRSSRAWRKSSMESLWNISSSSSDDQQIRMGINTLSSVNEHSISAKFKTGEGVDLSLHYRHHPHFGMPSDLQIRLLGRCLFSAGPAEWNIYGWHA